MKLSKALVVAGACVFVVAAVSVARATTGQNPPPAKTAPVKADPTAATMKDLPEIIQKAVKGEYPKGTVTAAHWTVTVKDGTKTHTVKVSLDGKVQK